MLSGGVLIQAPDQSRSGRFREDRTPSRPGIEPLFVGRQARCVVTIPAAVSQLPCLKIVVLIVCLPDGPKLFRCASNTYF